MDGGFAERFGAIWLAAMRDPASRITFEAFFGGVWGVLGWWIGEKLCGRLSTVVKSWIPFMVGGLGVPFAALVVALVPGLDYPEMASVISAVGAVAAKGSHDLANRFPVLKDVSGVRPPPAVDP